MWRSLRCGFNPHVPTRYISVSNVRRAPLMERATAPLPIGRFTQRARQDTEGSGRGGVFLGTQYRFGTPHALENPLDLELSEEGSFHQDMGLEDVPAAFRDVSPGSQKPKGSVTHPPQAHALLNLMRSPSIKAKLEGTQEEVEDRAARRIQAWFRTRAMRGVSLNRLNLMARLQHEGLVRALPTPHTSCSLDGRDDARPSGL